ncbi:MAG: hypothetical protein IT324_32005 [Anaerolineae bacterium]|nr:hypothetical protein [Anaerolineae bacterium]
MTIYLVYRDMDETSLQTSRLTNGFELIGKPIPGSKMVRTGVLRGRSGCADIHVAHIVSGEMFIVVYTNHALNAAERRRIVDKANVFVGARYTSN